MKNNTKHIRKGITAILFATVMIASALAVTTPVQADKVECPTVEDASLSNAYLMLGVADHGAYSQDRFTLGTTGGDPSTTTDNNKRLLYGWDPSTPSPGTSFTTIRIDSTNYKYGESGTWISGPSVVGNSIESAWDIGDIRVTQRLAFVTSSSGCADTTDISYTVENQGSVAHSVGTRIMMDTMLGDNDAAPFSIPGVGDITTETEFTGADVPETWFVYDSLSSPTVTALGTLEAYITPDRFTLSNWGRIVGTVWDFAITPGASNGDSAVGIWWYPTTLESGDSRTYTTYYGIGYIEITPGVLTVGLTSPASVDVGDTFTVTAFVENTGGSTANGVTASISLPTGLSLASGETAEKSIGDLSSGGTGLASWDVIADGAATGDLTYTVTVASTTPGIDPTIASRDISVIAIVNNPPVADAGPDQTVEQDTLGGASVTLDGSGSSDPDGDSLTYSWTWDGESDTEVSPTVSLPLGTTIITLVVNDGTVDSAPDTVDITVQDTTPPVITCPPDVTIEQATADGTVVPLTATATDICDADPTNTSDELAIYPLGTTTVTFTATDDAGNSASCTTTVTVEDTTPPVISCPDDVTVEQETADGTIVTLTATATDICDADPTITSDEQAIYPLGTTTVTFTATDDSGNSASCSMEVTVEDTRAPTVTITDPADAAEIWYRETMDVEYTVSDICDADPTVVVTPSDPIAAPLTLGTLPITVSATDSSGNTGSDSVTVTVIGPMDLKEQAVADLEAAKTGDKKTDKKIDDAIKHIQNSMDDKLWADELHLDTKHGKKVFDEEKKAVKDITGLCKCKGIEDMTLKYTGTSTVDIRAYDKGDTMIAEVLDASNGDTTIFIDGTTLAKGKLGTETTVKIFVRGTETVIDTQKIHTSCSKPLDEEMTFGDLEVIEVSKIGDLEDCPTSDIIKKLVQADEELAKTAIDDAKATTVTDPKKQDKVDKEIAKAEEELVKAEDELNKGKPDKAIDHYKKAWEHAQKAIEHAQK